MAQKKRKRRSPQQRPQQRPADSTLITPSQAAEPMALAPDEPTMETETAESVVAADETSADATTDDDAIVHVSASHKPDSDDADYDDDDYGDDGDGDDGGDDDDDDDDDDGYSAPITPPATDFLGRYGLMLLVGAVFAIGIAAILFFGLRSGSSNSPTAKTATVHVPSTDVAQVGSTDITKTTYNQWLKVALTSSTNNGAALDPPTFAKCVADLQKQPVASGQKKPTTAAAKSECQEEYSSAEQQVVEFLIQGQWVRKQAAAENITATSAELASEKKAQFPKASAETAFLKKSGETQAQLQYDLDTVVLENQLEKKAVGTIATPSAQQVSSYYTKNKKQYYTAKNRDLLVIVTKTKAQSMAAVNAIKGGESFAAAAKKYSTDTTTKNQGGKVTGITSGEVKPASFNKAIFSAKLGQLMGPVKASFGWVVFEATAQHAAVQKTLAQVKTEIIATIKQTTQQSRLQTFSNTIENHYKPLTKCQTGVYQVTLCVNAPKTSSAAPEASGSSAPETTTATTTSAG